uniref:Uncharacterized protein n=1 Tax=Panagrolaimus sp. ES5 TaxID=591445 RepID=A0AC34FLW7_9BILA
MKFNFRISKVSQKDAEAHEICAKSADSVLKHAHCVSDLLRKSSIQVNRVPPDRDTQTLFNRLKPKQIHQPAKPLERIPEIKRPTEISQKPAKIHENSVSIQKFKSKKSLRFEKLSKRNRFQKFRHRFEKLKINPKTQNVNSAQKWREKSIFQSTKIGAFGVVVKDQRRRRGKRYIFRTASEYHLQDGTSKMSPFGIIAKHLTKRILKLKNKTSASSWQSVIDKAQKTANKKRKLKKARQHLPKDSMEDMALGVFGRDRFQNEELDEVLKDKSKRKQLFQKMQHKPKNPQQKLTGLLRDGMKLAYTILGKNISNFDEKNLKFMSPKLFSVTTDDENGEDDDPIDVLSPSLLSLHGNGKGFERALSLPNLVKGFTTADQQQWLDLIFEASGVEETLQKADNALIVQEFQARKKRSYEEKMRDSDGQPLYFTKEKAIEVLGDSEEKRINISESLIKSYTKEQMNEMNETGYILLNPKQLELVYGTTSPYANAKMIEYFSNLTASKIHEQIENEILNLKEYSYKDDAIDDNSNLTEYHRSKRDIVLSPTIGATILFNPALPSQPIVFTPIILSPMVMSPFILTPS